MGRRVVAGVTPAPGSESEPVVGSKGDLLGARSDTSVALLLPESSSPTLPRGRERGGALRGLRHFGTRPPATAARRPGAALRMRRVTTPGGQTIHHGGTSGVEDRRLAADAPFRLGPGPQFK